mgnify:CR=1 FL=1
MSLICFFNKYQDFGYQRISRDTLKKEILNQVIIKEQNLYLWDSWYKILPRKTIDWIIKTYVDRTPPRADEYDCDDYALRMYAWVKLHYKGNVTLGRAVIPAQTPDKPSHKLNIVYSDEETLYFIEPQKPGLELITPGQELLFLEM